jgi:thiamine kinase-like enzyme
VGALGVLLTVAHSLLDDVVARVPGMDAPFEASVLPGGLTNRNYQVRSANGRQLVVRLSSAQSAVLAIDRDAERFNSEAAASTGVAPAVVAHLPELGALVVEWIDARTLEPSDLDDSAMLARIAATCRRLHAGPRFIGDFDMFALQRRYLDQVLSSGFRLPPTYLDFAEPAAAIESAMRVRDEGTAPCHNDLLAANIMDDGEQLWLVDFEYSGNADPCFELGNVCSEADLGTDRLEELLAAYYGSESPAKVARARLFGIMSDYGWTLWASIQSATSDVEFDFWSWGLEKFDRATAQFRGPDLPRLIAAVQQP